MKRDVIVICWLLFALVNLLTIDLPKRMYNNTSNIIY